MERAVDVPEDLLSWLQPLASHLDRRSARSVDRLDGRLGFSRRAAAV
ncbi:MAG: hypothetical protein NZ602_10775 [Thermoguttaceae bacterium]|nr:hypothetical protein [Thermoguttaceae bacterium]MDW8037544.1 hypothetical protein [Thermoguttaceae bacterium]